MHARPQSAIRPSRLKIPAPKWLAFSASGLLAFGAFAADGKPSSKPDPKCLAQQKIKGLDEDAAEKLCKERKKRQNRIYYKPPEEPVEMTVGSPPMVSDDTGTPGPGNWEINFVVSGDVAKDSRSFDAPLLDINYGIGEKLQLKFEVPYVYSRFSEYDETGAKTTTTLRGVANSKVGVKYRFYDNEESGLSLAVYPQLEFRTPGARLEADGGAAAPGTEITLPLLLTWELDHVSFTADAGFEKASGESRLAWFASFGAGLRLTEKLALLGEIAGRELGEGGERRFLVNAGLRGKISESRFVVASVGRDLVADGNGQHHCYFTVAYQLLIGHAK